MVDKRESITAKLCAFARAWHSNKARRECICKAGAVLAVVVVAVVVVLVALVL